MLQNNELKQKIPLDQCSQWDLCLLLLLIILLPDNFDLNRTHGEDPFVRHVIGAHYLYFPWHSKAIPRKPPADREDGTRKA